MLFCFRIYVWERVSRVREWRRSERSESMEKIEWNGRMDIDGYRYTILFFSSHTPKSKTAELRPIQPTPLHLDSQTNFQLSSGLGLLFSACLMVLCCWCSLCSSAATPVLNVECENVKERERSWNEKDDENGLGRRAKRSEWNGALNWITYYLHWAPLLPPGSNIIMRELLFWNLIRSSILPLLPPHTIYYYYFLQPTSPLNSSALRTKGRGWDTGNGNNHGNAISFLIQRSRIPVTSVSVQNAWDFLPTVHIQHLIISFSLHLFI